MRVYISGKITGLDIKVAEEYFGMVENEIKSAGHVAVNPFKVVPYNPELTWKDYMLQDISALMDCDAILMLVNWRESKGAKIEHSIAEHMGMKIFYQKSHNLF